MATAATEKTELLTLFGQDVPDVAAGTKFEGEHIALELIETDPDQPRQEPDDELLDLVKLHGVRKAIIVTPAPAVDTRTDGVRYRILDGERRYVAATKAGHTTIPAVVDRRPMTPLQRLVLQAALNASKALAPMDEAQLFNRLKEEGGLSDQQIADICKRKKSTVSDRLALVNMPDCFRVHFMGDTPLLSAAAAPIIRKFLGVPENILEMAARTAPADIEWDRAKRNGKPVELSHVGRVLDRIILAERMRELSEELVLTYRGLGGVTCKVAGVEYAIDVPKFIEAERKLQAEKQRANTNKAQAAHSSPSAGDDEEDEVLGEIHNSNADLWDSGEERPAEAGGWSNAASTAGSVAVPAPTSKPAAPSKPLVSAAERKRIAKEDQQRDAAARKATAWRTIRPQLLAAIAAALKIAPTGAKDPVGQFVAEEFARSVGTDVDAVVKLVPRGATAQDLIRHFAMLCLFDDLSSDFNSEGVPRRIRELGLKVDVVKMLDAAMKGAEKGSKATRSAGTSKPDRASPESPRSTPKRGKAKSAPKAKAKAPAKKKARKR